MNSYYGTNNKKDKFSNTEKLKEKDKELRPEDKLTGSFIGCCKQTFVVLSAILGILSLGLIIALNAANLAEIYRNKNEAGEVNTATSLILKEVSGIQAEVQTDIKPKLESINTATTFGIPTLIGSHSKLLQNDIIKYCSPRYDNEGKDCPVKYNPTHSSKFSELDPWKDFDCIQNDGDYTIRTNMTFYPFISFIPSPTTLTGCNRDPSFSLSSHIYSYTHTSMINQCYGDVGATQYWVIGSIKSDQVNKPYFENSVSWPMMDAENRRSCSTVAGIKGAWLGCTSRQTNEEIDFNTTGIEPLILQYMDVFGIKKQWKFDEAEIRFDREYDALYFSMGSGIIKDDKVYFLMFGALRSDWDQPAYCSSPGCTLTPMPQDECNRAQRPYYYKQKQVVNALLIFENNPMIRPEPSVRTIPPHNYDLGAQGRLYYFPYQNKLAIYKRSSSWHSYLFYGIINLSENITVNWFPIRTVTRPGTNGCPGNNHCPAVCVVGAYNDLYPIARNAELFVTMMLRDNTRKINPTIRVASWKKIFMNYSIRSQTQAATTSTTTCFKFLGQVWCLVIAELQPGTIGSSQPTALLFPLQFECVRNQTMSLNDLGSGDEGIQEIANDGLLLA